MLLSTATTGTAATPRRPPYPLGVPSKFSPSGAAQVFPGNTTLCHLPANSPLIPGLHALTTALSPFALAGRIIFLPPASWHMTVVDGVCDTVRNPDRWPPGHSQQSMADCTTHFALQLKETGRDLQKQGLGPPYRMRVVGFDPADVGIGVVVTGATVEEERRLRRLRDKLAEAMGFRHATHDSYELHISVAYLLRHLDGEEREELKRVLRRCLEGLKGEFELGAVEFCTFEDMFAYRRLFYLRESDGRPGEEVARAAR